MAILGMEMRGRFKLFCMMLLCNLIYVIIYLLYVRNPSVMCSKPDGLGQLMQYMCNFTTKEEERTLPSVDLAPCPEISPHLLGPMAVEFKLGPTLASVRMENPGVMDGGRSKPANCTSLKKVAVIIPFRNRHSHLNYWLLNYWLHYLHPFLQRQQLDYGIYIINQVGQTKFNRAKLMNVGYAEALKEYDYDCFVFSDVDLVPMDDHNAYSCFSKPRHLSVAVDKFGFRLPYNRIFGGVSALSREQYLKINGFPNRFWGWGGEDDDVYNRISLNNMLVSRPSLLVGRYRMIRHNGDLHNEPNPKRFNMIRATQWHMDKDGFNSLRYMVVKIQKDQLFTIITVDVGTPGS